MLLRHITTLVAAAVVSLALASLTGDASSVQAADSARVKTCGGGSIELKAAEKRMLDLHNQARTNRGLSRLCVDYRLFARH